MKALRFEPVNLEKDFKTCIAFRADSFVVSFGNADKFYDDVGPGAEKYIDWLKAKIAKDPYSVLHVYLENKIIGQVELGKLKEDPTRGYVNLYYLIPEMRGQGLGAQLDQHAVAYFRQQNLKSMRLSVSPTNAQAMAYYKKMGWSDLGPRQGHPEVHFMEKNIS